jgi:hypothetical protein
MKTTKKQAEAAILAAFGCKTRQQLADYMDSTTLDIVLRAIYGDDEQSVLPPAQNVKRVTGCIIQGNSVELTIGGSNDPLAGMPIYFGTVNWEEE